jgi:hypothetical protein
MIKPIAVNLSRDILDTLSVEEIIYNDTVAILGKNQISSRHGKIENENGIFKFYSGGMDNNVFVNKDVSLKIGDDYFLYAKDDKEYIIYSSVESVFIRVAHAMRMNYLEEA